MKSIFLFNDSKVSEVDKIRGLIERADIYPHYKITRATEIYRVRFSQRPLELKIRAIALLVPLNPLLVCFLWNVPLNKAEFLLESLVRDVKLYRQGLNYRGIGLVERDLLLSREKGEELADAVGELVSINKNKRRGRAAA